MFMDAHFDLGVAIAQRRDDGEREVFKRCYEGDLRAGGVDCVVGALFVESRYVPEMALRRALDQIACVYREADESAGSFSLCTNMKQAEAARSAGRVAVFLSLEGADPIGSDLGLLRIFYELGVRAVGLVWSRRNDVADGCHFSDVRAGTPGGLTRFGVELVEEAERLGMLIDVSHLNDPGVSDVLAVARGPVIASHSNCRALVDHPRNLTDDQIRAIAATGGVVGVNACSAFLSREPGASPGVAEIADHIDHIVALVGDDHAGIGLDLCDSLAATSATIDSHDVIANHSHAPEIFKELVRRGYSETSLRKIRGLNFKRAYEEVCRDE